MSFELRPVVDEEFAAFARLVDAGFGHAPSEEEIAYARTQCRLDRTLAAFDGSEMVGTAGAKDLEVTVPGGASMRAAGITAVGVRMTHRRRGVMRAMMARQLADLAASGEPLAVLTASESLLYGRFGYGLATQVLGVAIESRHSRFAAPVLVGGRLRSIDGAEARKVLPSYFEQTRRRRPGEISRNEAWWDKEAEDPAWWRDGRGAKFWLVHEGTDGGIDGFVSWRVAENWADEIARNRVDVIDLLGSNDLVEAALWRAVLDLDLVAEVFAERPVDEPLRWRLEDPRRLRTRNLRDFLWVRLLDVPAALAARIYGIDATLTISVATTFPEPRVDTYELVGGPEASSCRPSSRSADLSLGLAELGAIYLGGVRPSMLLRAGRVVEHRPGAVRDADLMFTTATPPFCRTEF